MLKRQHKSDSKLKQGPGRVLVVDDHTDSARLVAKLFRRAGFEVAEVSDHQVAIMTMMNAPAPISAVVASFSGSGNAASLKLLDAVRHTPDHRVNSQRMILILDTGADDVLLRPYPGEELVRTVQAAIARTDEERAAYRRDKISGLSDEVHSPRRYDQAPIVAAQFN